MRTLLVRSLLAATVSLLSAGPAMGEEDLQSAVAKTRRELETLKIQLRLYRQVEHPRRIRELDAAVRLTQAEIDTLEDRVRYYKRVDGIRSQPVLWEALQEAELSLLEARLRRDHLVQERLALRRSFGDCCRLLELEIARVRAHLAELEHLRLPAPAF